ncbi:MULTISPECIES: nucleoside/nucleotide kinase family protein [unclassified Terrabacter]|uniref:nucleoside/nucleotide kinase family protein n=1 Tax=unclassified Terrabacter TaxID=2630222 RepID=UPI0006F23802|nr:MULTISPECIES: nucleoside/nucleotide kinase family protein [unclassified Terrabacter]KRB43082.1 fructose transporter [Terrabacter sp. Root181]KRF46737.1 fructose transporter [Terrabacter sp. Soil810]
MDAGTDAGMDELAAAAVALVGDRRRVVLGIAGAPGAGKSTLAEALVEAVASREGDGWVAQVPMDGFHLADAQLDRLGLRSRKGAPDTFDADGYAALLRRLVEQPDTWVYAPGFERTLEQPVAAAVVVPPSARLVVTEGNYLLLPEERWERARAQLAEVWLVSGDDDLRRSRLLERHVRFGKAPAEAEAWVAGNDDVNAALVLATGDADRVVLNGPDGWSLSG